MSSPQDRRMLSMATTTYEELLKFKLQLQAKLGRPLTYSAVIKYLLENQRGI